MHYLFRKSIKIVAGLCLLLFLNNCTTITQPKEDGFSSVAIDDIFDANRETLVYINKNDNNQYLELITESIELDKHSLEILNKSDEVFAAFDSDLTSGFDVVLNGEYSKRKYEFGLFLSLKWHKTKSEGFSYWMNDDGLKLYFLNNNQIIVSTFNITPIIKILESNYLDTPNESLILILQNMDDDQNESLSGGFIKSGINSLSFYLIKEENQYDLDGILSLDSESKAKGFSRIIKLVLNIALSAGEDSNLSKIGENLVITTENNKVLVGNIKLNDNMMLKLINNFILYDGDADK